jgi:undecaprenyl-diphosphatase
MEQYYNKRLPIIRWIFALIFAAIFITDVVFVVNNKTDAIDQSILDTVALYRDSFLTIVAKGITFLSDSTTMIGICVVLLILPTRTRFGIPLTVGVGAASVCHYALKHIIERARPDEAMRLVEVSGYSFPSGHSNAGLVFYLFLMILLYRYFKLGGHRAPAYIVAVLLPILVVAIGASRIYLSVHFPSDIIGGWSLGAVLLIIIVTLYDRFYPVDYRLHDEPPEWGMMRKRKPWRKPQVVAKDSDVVDLPKNRSAWRPPAKIHHGHEQKHE